MTAQDFPDPVTAAQARTEQLAEQLRTDGSLTGPERTELAWQVIDADAEARRLKAEGGA